MQFLGRGWFCLLTLLVLGPVLAVLAGYGYAQAAGLSRAALAKGGDGALWNALAIGAITLWLVDAAALFSWFRFGRGVAWWTASGAGGRATAVICALLAGGTVSFVPISSRRGS